MKFKKIREIIFVLNFIQSFFNDQSCIFYV